MCTCCSLLLLLLSLLMLLSSLLCCIVVYLDCPVGGGGFWCIPGFHKAAVIKQHMIDYEDGKFGPYVYFVVFTVLVELWSDSSQTAVWFGFLHSCYDT